MILPFRQGETKIISQLTITKHNLGTLMMSNLFFILFDTIARTYWEKHLLKWKLLKLLDLLKLYKFHVTENIFSFTMTYVNTVILSFPNDSRSPKSPLTRETYFVLYSCYILYPVRTFTKIIMAFQITYFWEIHNMIIHSRTMHAGYISREAYSRVSLWIFSYASLTHHVGSAISIFLFSPAMHPKT